MKSSVAYIYTLPRKEFLSECTQRSQIKSSLLKNMELKVSWRQNLKDNFTTNRIKYNQSATNAIKRSNINSKVENPKASALQTDHQIVKDFRE